MSSINQSQPYPRNKKKKKKQPSIEDEIAARRVPPQNVESEQAVLGALLLHNDSLYSVVGELKPGDFYIEKHRWIYESVLEQESNNEPRDMISVANRLRARSQLEETGGLPYLASLVDSIPTAANIKYYAKLVSEKSLLRQLIKANTEILEDAYDEGADLGTIFDRAEQRIFEIREQRANNDLVPIQETIKVAFQNIEKLYEKKSLVTGVGTGFEDFDKMTSGLQASDLLILAGRPAMGKTSIALNIATNSAVLHGAGVAIFSLEMSKEQLVTRILCSQARVDASRMRTGHMLDGDIPKLTRAAAELSNSSIFIDDGGNASVMEVRAKCRRLKMQYGNLGLILIDYLQLMSGDSPGQSREQEISTISRGLKGLAKELDVPVLALSQLNRSLERRPDKRPVMSDLRESGAIEQDADIIMFIYRDEVYNPDTEDKGMAELIIGKQRSGPTGTVRLRFFGQYTRFENLYPEDQ